MAISAVEGLASAIKGRVVDRDDSGYDEARALYNAMIDKHPAAVAYCVDEADVAAAIGFARERGLRIAVRGGGHNGAGLGKRRRRAVHRPVGDEQGHGRPLRADGARAGRRKARRGRPRDARARARRSRPGSSRRPASAGLTLGGGVGHLTRVGGLTIDNLVAATVVLADGSVVQTDAEREPRSVLGDSRRRRQLRRRHVVLVPRSSGQHRPGGAGALRPRRRRRRAALVPRVLARAAGRS